MTPTGFRGFVLSRRERAESDLSVELLIDEGRVVRAIARAGARSTRRFGAGLAPFVRYRFKTGRARGDRPVALEEAVVERAHAGILAELRRSMAAGAAAVLVRDLGTHTSGDPVLFRLYDGLLDALDAADAREAGADLLRFAIGALAGTGHPFELARCVRCGRTAPDDARVTVQPASGGVVCRACGGGSISLTAAERSALRQALAGEVSAFEPSMLEWLADMLAPHAPRAATAIRGARAHWP